MAPDNFSFVFIAGNRKGRLHIDSTEDLYLAMRWLKAGAYDRRCRIHRIDKLLYFEACASPVEAHERADELKALNRRRLNLFISDTNVARSDLSSHWFPVAAVDRNDDDPDGGVLARLPRSPLERGPGHTQSLPPVDGDVLAVHG